MKNKKQLFRFTTIGSVDNGKSTLIGRLLHDSKAIYKNQYEELENLKSLWHNDQINLAHLTDGLKKEREEGITIDVAYRYFSTPKRKFIISDSPGHLEFTRNMVTGSSNANAAVILIDAVNGLDEQTKRHTIISSLLRIPHIIVCVNKMDKVGFEKQRFEEIRQDYESFSSKLQFTDVRFIPISALNGDNIVSKSKEMPWYAGTTLMYTLENMYFSGDKDLVNCRFPIQTIIQNEEKKYLCGTVAGGIFKKGDRVLVLPQEKTSTITRLSLFDKEYVEAIPMQSITMELADDIEIKRGNLIARPNNKPAVSTDIDAMICWFDDKQELQTGKEYIFFSLANKSACTISSILYKLDIETLHRNFDFEKIRANDIARIQIKAASDVFHDSYSKNRKMGSFILIDKTTNNTVAAGMIR